MPLLSSPLTYPSSSFPIEESPRKRRKIEPRRSPLKELALNKVTKVVGGFLVDDDSEGETDWIGSKATGISRDATRSLKVVPDTLGAEFSLISAATTPERELESDDITEVQGDEPAFLLPPGFSLPLKKFICVKACSGKSYNVAAKPRAAPIPYEELIAARSRSIPGRAKKSYYGIDIHRLMDDAVKETAAATAVRAEAPRATVEPTTAVPAGTRNSRTMMWTEKYRARKFTDLIGDERTHRSVLRWLKGWDAIVFPGASRSKTKASKSQNDSTEERPHRKILLLTGPPGLGKTTLAHVCARQAGYEVQEINASDERSRDVVKGRIRDMLGTENVRMVDSKASGKKAARPVCIIVDEVDGVVGGSGGGGEGGFVKALIDLVHLDQKNLSTAGYGASTTGSRKKKKGDSFRMLRPLILICNDLYHPALRLLRQGTIAEITHVRNPALNMIVSRMQSIFERESVPCESDGVRRLCEAAWGVSTRKEGGQGKGCSEGDIRGVMVVGEWVASKIKAAGSSDTTSSSTSRLTRRWVEEHVLNDLSHGGGAARSLGRGGAREVVDRVFLEGAGFPRDAVAAQTHLPVNDGLSAGGVAEASKKRTMDRLRDMVNTSGESDRIISDCFTNYPSYPFHDDTLLTKPTTASHHLHFHDRLSTLVHHQQEWELASYLSQSVLAFHHLFASPATARSSLSAAGPSSSRWGIGKDHSDAAEPEEISPFTGPRADFEAKEAMAANTAHLQAWQASLSLPLQRQFRSLGELATDLLPYILRMLSPNVKPVVVGGADKSTASVRKASEKEMVGLGANAMLATGVAFERTRVETDSGSTYGGGASAAGWVYRMEPPLDDVGAYLTMNKGTGESDGKVRFAVRQVLDAECRREMAKRADQARKARWAAGGCSGHENSEGVLPGKADEGAKEKIVQDAASKGRRSGLKRDFFGRVISDSISGAAAGEKSSGSAARMHGKGSNVAGGNGKGNSAEEGRVWVSFHEGYSNAVRKPITMEELLRGL